MKKETAKKIVKYLDLVESIAAILGGIATIGMIAKGKETPSMRRIG